MSEQTAYDQNWLSARIKAKANGLQIIEHGWEQHVIINEPNGLVYRYPRHAAAAAKLNDEVNVLKTLHTQNWPIELPVMKEHNNKFSSYNYIEGEVLDKKLLRVLSNHAIENIGSELGTFLVQLHDFDPVFVGRKKTKQKPTLLEYYANRINKAPNASFYPKAKLELDRLINLVNTTQQVVVHGDLHGLNIVINPKGGLAGVIDLSEIEVGDPHQDFRKLFMTDQRLLEPAVNSYSHARDIKLNLETIKSWAYTNEWANLCHFAATPANSTYQRALRHLRLWGQF